GEIFHLSANFINLLANPMIVFYEMYQSSFIGSFLSTLVHPYGPLYAISKFHRMHNTLKSIPILNLRYDEYKNLIPFPPPKQQTSGTKSPQSSETQSKQQSSEQTQSKQPPSKQNLIECTAPGEDSKVDCQLESEKVRKRAEDLEKSLLKLPKGLEINNPGYDEFYSIVEKFLNNLLVSYYVILRETYLEPYSNQYSALTFLSIPAISFVIPHKQYQYDCEYLKCLIDAYNLRAEPSYCEDILIIKNAKYPEFFSMGHYLLGGLLNQILLSLLINSLDFIDFEDNHFIDDILYMGILYIVDIFDSNSIRNKVLSTTFNLQDDLSKYLYETYYRGYVVNDNGVYKLNASGYLIPLDFMEIAGKIVTSLIVDTAKEHLISWASSSLGSWVDSWGLYDPSNKCNVIGLFIKFVIDETLRWLLDYSFSNVVAYFKEASSSATSTYSAPYYSTVPNFKFNFEPVMRTFFEGCLMQTLTNQMLSSIGGTCGKSTWDPVTFLIFYNYYFFGKDISSPNNETALKIYSRQAKLLINQLFVGSILKSIYSLIPSNSEESRVCNLNSILENAKDYLHLGSYAEFAMSYRRRISELCSLLARASGSSGKDIKEMFELLVGFEVPCNEYVNYCEPITTCDSWEKFKKEVLFKSSKNHVYSCSNS
ncbi:MAG: hypothetical protein QXR30_04325, partial [Candidatus Woesearchaeota archaeon]